MAKDYGRSRPQRRGNSGSKQFLMVLLAFLIGYLTASVFDFVSLSHWVNTKLMAQQNNAPTASEMVAKKTELPKPKFEFYTLLANGRTLTPANQKTAEKPASTAAVVEAKPTAIASTASLQTAENKPTVPNQAPLANNTKESYIIQVGSFKTPPEAERMKATLILKGFSVNIVPVAQANQTWYRVIIGPYHSQSDAQKVQIAFAQSEHVRGMIRKI